MTYVTDTHALLWYLTDNPNLSSHAKEVFQRAEEGEATIVITTISLMELLYICKKRLALHQFYALLQKLAGSINYFVYELDFQVVLVCTELEKVEEMHDRVITATAKLLDVPVITSDGNIRDSGYVKVEW